MDTIILLVLMIVLLLIELATVSLTTIWFSAGGLGGLICAICGIDTWIQILVFIIVSAVFVFATRPFVKKMSDNQTIPTNSDRLVGMTGLVTKAILEGEKGEVKVEYQKWPAISKSSKVFKVGEKVVITEIIGNKLIVEELKEIEIN